MSQRRNLRLQLTIGDGMGIVAAVAIVCAFPMPLSVAGVLALGLLIQRRFKAMERTRCVAIVALCALVPLAAELGLLTSAPGAKVAGMVRCANLLLLGPIARPLILGAGAGGLVSNSIWAILLVTAFVLGLRGASNWSVLASFAALAAWYFTALLALLECVE